MSLSLRCDALQCNSSFRKKIYEDIVLKLFNIIENYCYGMLEGKIAIWKIWGNIIT